MYNNVRRTVQARDVETVQWPEAQNDDYEAFRSFLYDVTILGDEKLEYQTEAPCHLNVRGKVRDVLGLRTGEVAPFRKGVQGCHREFFFENLYADICILEQHGSNKSFTSISPGSTLAQPIFGDSCHSFTPPPANHDPDIKYL